MENTDKETEALLAQFKPLEDRILGLVVNTPVWNYKTVEQLFPNEHPKAIYRAMKRLENSGQIRFVGYHKRLKQYTTYDVSNLPLFPDKDGNKHSLRTLALGVPNMLDDKGNWSVALLLNDLPIIMAQCFDVARLEDKELVDGYNHLIRRLVRLRAALSFLTSWVDTLLNHPIMNGDPAVFKSILQKEMLENSEINQFNAWYSRVLANQKADKNASSQDS